MQKALFLLVFCSLLGCSSTAALSPIVECRNLCQGKKVEFFRDEVMECRCSSAATVEEK